MKLSLNLAAVVLLLVGLMTSAAEAQYSVTAPVLSSNSKGAYKPLKAKGGTKFLVRVRLYKNPAATIPYLDSKGALWMEELEFSIQGKKPLAGSDPSEGRYTLYIPVTGYLDLNIGVKKELPSDIGNDFVYCTTQVVPFKKDVAQAAFAESPTKFIAGSPTTTTTTQSAVPHPRDMVDMYTDDEEPGLQRGEVRSVYEVPAGKYFVMTHCYGGHSLLLLEDLGGVLTAKAYIHGGFPLEPFGNYTDDRAPPGLIGFAFRPGSSVSFKNLGDPYETAVPRRFLGYLVDEIPTSTTPTFPPHPSNMVNVTSRSHPYADEDGGIFLNVGEMASVYEVPADKYFVMTRVIKFRDDEGPGAGGFLVEDFGGVLTVKATTYVDEGHLVDEPLGIVFRPGSSVSIQSTWLASYDPTGRLSTDFIGYLVDE